MKQPALAPSYRQDTEDFCRARRGRRRQYSLEKGAGDIGTTIFIGGNRERWARQAIPWRPSIDGCAFLHCGTERRRPCIGGCQRSLSEHYQHPDRNARRKKAP